MYAIIKTGGKQYRVAKGDVIDVELLDVQDGANVEFKDVLIFCNGSDTKVGAPIVDGCTVVGEVVAAEVGGPKVMSVKYKRSHNQYRKFGHRQHYSRIKITDIRAKEARREKHGT